MRKHWAIIESDLAEQGIDTTGMYPMGSAEGTMSVFAKNGRSWAEKGAGVMLSF